MLPPDAWMAGRANRRWVEGGRVRLSAEEVRAEVGLALCFGEGVAFDKAAARGDGA